MCDYSIAEKTYTKHATWIMKNIKQNKKKKEKLMLVESE